MSRCPGYPFYGQAVGVLVFRNRVPRIPGDAGHAGSFSYPVCYEVIPGGFGDLVKGSPQIKKAISEGGKYLVSRGIRAVLGDCGMMSLYQDCMGAELGILFAGSSLCQIPMIWQLLGRQGTIGVITGHSGLLQKEHLYHSGWNEEIPIVVQGMEEEAHFREIVIDGGYSLVPERMEREVLSAGKKLAGKCPALRAVVLECSNLASYSAALAAHLMLPVFDTMSAANLIHYAVEPDRYL